MQTYTLFCVSTLAIFLFSVSSFAQQNSVKKMTVEIRKSIFYLNGTAVKFPIASAELENVIGKPDRTMEGVRRVATWDKLGLTGYQKVDSDKYMEIGFILNVAENTFSFTPEKLYNGSLIIDGVHITAASTRDSVNRKKTGGKFKPVPLAGMFSENKTGRLYLFMWQEAKRRASGSGKILQINIGIDPDLLK